MLNKYKNNELLVRKRIAAFIENMFIFLGYDFRHDLYKRIVYGETEAQTPLEEKIKNYYDAYMYLLSNNKSPFTMNIFKRFLYIINGKDPDSALILRITTLFYKIADEAPIERSTLFHLQAFNELSELGEEQQFIVSLILFNYSLVKSGIPTVMFVPFQFPEYVDCRDKYFEGEQAPIFGFMTNVLLKAKMQDKSYYKNLIPITVSDIFKTLTADREMLFEKYGVKHIYLFGSLAKGQQRIDSDIDLLVNFSLDLTFEEKEQNAKAMFDYYTNVFHRFVDINAVGEYLSDELLKETSRHKKIF